MVTRKSGKFIITIYENNIIFLLFYYIFKIKLGE